MTKLKYSNSIAEVLHYLKGIREEDINKIPEEFIEYLKENSSKEYIPNFDFTKPLKDLNIMNETKGIICFICYNYWCENEKDKEEFLNTLNENEKKFQEKLKEKYANEINTKKLNEETQKIKLEVEEILPVTNEIKKKSKIASLYQKILDFIKGCKRNS